MPHPAGEGEAPPSDATILRQFVARPREVGAVWRSGPALGRAMARAVRWNGNASVVEAGAGDGGITESLLRAKPKDTAFLAVEVNPACTAALERRLPGVRVVLDDLANLPAICERERLHPVGAVVATLPWSLLPPSRQQTLLEAILASLDPGGQLLFYLYLQALPFFGRSPFARRIRERFRTVERGPVVWRNLPPAVVFDCRGLLPPDGGPDPQPVPELGGLRPSVAQNRHRVTRPPSDRF